MHRAIRERQLWDLKYRQGSHSSTEPDDFLLSAYEDFVEPLFPQGGSALDVAGGVGRHSAWLAARGWRVTLTDISEVAIATAKKAMLLSRLSFETRLCDLSSVSLPREKFDLILVFFYLERKLFPALYRALKPGGLLIYKTYTVEQRRFGGGPTHPLHLLKKNELLRAFARLRVLHYRETIARRGIAEFVGMRARSAK